MKKFILIFVIALLLTACGDERADNIDKGIKLESMISARMFKRADIVLPVWENLAEDGNVEAQLEVARAYESGYGTIENDKTAFNWYSRAANQGNGRAQFNMSLAYTVGQVVKTDVVQAYKWMSLSADQGIQFAAGMRDLISTKMTPTKYAQARKLVSEFVAEKE